MKFLEKIVHSMRTPIYRLGLRPKPGSIFYSPSKSLMLGFGDAIKKVSTHKPKRPWKLPKLK